MRRLAALVAEELHMELPAGGLGAARPSEDLRRTSDRLDGILQVVTDGVTVNDSTGRIVYANEAAESLLGFGSDDPAEAFDAQGRRVPPPLRPERLALEGITPPESLLRFRVRSRGGPTDRWCVVRTAPIRDEREHSVAVVNVYRDVTEQKLSEDRLRFLARAGALLVGSLDGAALVDGFAALLVPEMVDFCSIDLAALEDQPARSIARHAEPGLLPAVPRPTDAARRALLTQRAEVVQIAASDISGDADLCLLKLTSAVAAPLLARGRVIGSLTMGSTASRAPLGAAELGLCWDLASRLAQALDNARLYEAARESDRRKDEFLALLAHELRNPLAPVVTALDLARRGAEHPARVNAILTRQVGHLVRLVDDLLDVSRITRGKIELRREVCELQAVVSRAVETSHPLVMAHHHALAVDGPKEPIHFYADPVRVTQILSNLMNNAARYSERGGIIRLAVRREDDQIVARVRDDGIGIAADQLANIFEPFVQGRQCTGDAKAGLGIGLTLARGLAELHGGTLAAFSRGPGRGSEFTLRLPATIPESAHFTTPHEAASPPGQRSRRRVLVVDDNVDAAETLADGLRLAGHDVEVVHDGRSALECARLALPEVAVLDIGLPGMSGHELARSLRELAAGRALRLIALSGYGQERDRKRSLEAGIDAHYTKPIELDAIEAAVAGRGP